MIQINELEIEWNPDLSVYASEPFLKSVGDEYGWLGGTDDSGELRCILPWTIVSKALTRMVRFRVETIPVGAGLSLEEEKEFLTLACRHLRAKGADIVIPATTNTIFRTYPDGAIAAPYGTLIIDLQQDEEVLFNAMSSSHRRKVRLSGKAGVQIKEGPGYAETAHALVRDTFKRSSLPFMTLPSFTRYLEGLGENVRIFVAEHQGVIQGSIVVPFSRHSAYYVYGGSIPEPVTGSMNQLHWDAMLMFRGLGVKRYDFCGVRIDPEAGSKQAGLREFKERFGPRLVQGYLWKLPLRRIKAKAYLLGVRLLRGGDIVDVERHKLPSSGH